MNLKKTISSILAIMLVAASTAGCSSASSGTESAAGQSGSASQDSNPTSLSVLCQSSWINAGTKAAFAVVEKSLNVKLEVEELPEGDAGNQLILAKMSTTEVPDILWWQSASTVNTLIGKDKFEDLSGDWQKNYDTTAIASRSYSADNKIIEAPFGDATVFGMCYNKAVFEKNGVKVPTTWAELLTACEKFKAAGVTPIYLSGKDSWTLQILPLDAFAKENKKSKTFVSDMETHKQTWSKLSDSKTVLNNMLEIVKKGFVQSTYLSDTYVDAQNALIDGKAAMYPQASWIAPELAKLTTDTAKLSNLGMFAIPNSDSNAIAAYAPPTGFLVPSAGKNKEFSKKVVNALCSKDAVTAMYKAQPGIPFIKGVEGNAIGIQKDAAALISNDKVYIQPAMKYQYGALATFIQDMLIGNKKPEDVLKAMDDAYATKAKSVKDPNWN